MYGEIKKNPLALGEGVNPQTGKSAPNFFLHTILLSCIVLTADLFTYCERSARCQVTIV